MSSWTFPSNVTDLEYLAADNTTTLYNYFASLFSNYQPSVQNFESRVTTVVILIELEKNNISHL